MERVWRQHKYDLKLHFVRGEGDVGVFTVHELAKVVPPGGVAGRPPLDPPLPVPHVPLWCPQCLAWPPVSICLGCLLTIEPL